MKCNKSATDLISYSSLPGFSSLISPLLPYINSIALDETAIFVLNSPH